MTHSSDPQRDSAPPEDVSNQNREEQSAPHPPAGGADTGRGDRGEREHPPEVGGASESSKGRPGGASEGSQATGHPGNAG